MTKTQDIRDAVELELSYDPLVDISDITVKNINGEVALNGTVPSFPQYLEAAAAARRVSGVKNVHNHLEVVLPPGDYRDDATLTTMANNALTLSIAVPDGVEATAKNGNLTLTGTVSYGAGRISPPGAGHCRATTSTMTRPAGPAGKAAPASTARGWPAARQMTLTSPTPSLTSPWSCRAPRCTGPSAWTPGGECIP